MAVAIGVNSYGTSEGVGRYTPKWTVGDDFTDTTNPTQDTVHKWINEISGILNAQLATAGFSIPILQADSVDAENIVINFVEQEVASMVEGLRGSGRFGPTRPGKSSKGTRFQILMTDIRSFLEEFASGLEELGATRDRSSSYGLEFRDVDDAGEVINPMFQRKFAGWNVEDYDS